MAEVETWTLGDLALPPSARGLVIFAHGSGSSRLSPRNRQVAQALNEAGLGTLLFDLPNVSDMPLLARRLVLATRWVQRECKLPIGYFGASTGAAAALVAAAELGSEVSAVVSRGGRPDLAVSHLARVSAPTLLLVGGQDTQVLEMNREALAQLKHGSLVIVPGATHLFEEPGTLERVAEEASAWFLEHLRWRSKVA